MSKKILFLSAALMISVSFFIGASFVLADEVSGTPLANSAQCGKLIYFCSDNSPYCNLTKPIIDQYALNSGCIEVNQQVMADFMKLNQDALAIKYNVLAVPTFLFVDKNGCFGDIGKGGATKIEDIKNGIADFKCQNQPAVTIISPNGGETYKNDGSLITVKWQTNNVPVSQTFDIIRLQDYPNGREYNLATNVLNDGQEVIPISSSIPAGSYTLEIKTYVGDTLVMDSSDSYFKIVSGSSNNNSPKIVGFPAIPANIQPGQTVNISLAATDPDNDDLSWSVDWGEGIGQVSACGLGQTGADWNFSANHAWAQAGTYQVKVKVSDCVGGSEAYSFSVTVGKSTQPPIIISPIAVEEQVKCVFKFKGPASEQKCYTATDDSSPYHNYGCGGTETCLVDLKGAKGDKITWKSSCGGYAYSVMDGSSEYAIFYCADSDISTTPTASRPVSEQIADINEKSKLISNNNFDFVLAELNELRNTVKEQQTEIKYLKSLLEGVKNLSEKSQDAINNFITYGVDANTEKLGAGERAAVMNSYKAAFKKLPETEIELADAIKIANGRFPSVISSKAEKTAKEQFIKIYKRAADLNDANDNAAIKVMAYGLRQKADNRNLNSEKAGIKIFKNIFGSVPKTTEDWNTMQAITYSGATR